MATIASTQAGAVAETHERWIGTDGWNLTSFTLGLLLESYIFGMSSIATGWVTMPTALRSLLLSWSPLWLIIGIAVAAPSPTVSAARQPSTSPCPCTAWESSASPSATRTG